MSPSAVHHFIDNLLAQNNSLDNLQNIFIACIGPTTAKAVEGYGIYVNMVPKIHTSEELVTNLLEHI